MDTDNAPSAGMPAGGAQPGDILPEDMLRDDLQPEDILPDGLPKILPPYEDGVFRSILTLPEAHAALVSVVAAVLGRPVTTVTLRNNAAPTRDRHAKREEYDINAVVDGEDGDQCNIEMQASHMAGDNRENDHRHVKWRSVYNLSHLHSNQPGSGIDYGDYVRSYQITLCNYNLFSFENELLESYMFRNERGVALCDAVEAIFVDLTKAREIAKKPVDEMSDIECWAVFFALGGNPKYSGVIDGIMKRKEGIAVAKKTLLSISRNPDERARFHSRRKWRQDREHDRAVARKEVRAEYEPLLASKDAEIASMAAENASMAAENASMAAELAALRAKLNEGQ